MESMFCSNCNTLEKYYNNSKDVCFKSRLRNEIEKADWFSTIKVRKPLKTRVTFLLCYDHNNTLTNSRVALFHILQEPIKLWGQTVFDVFT